MNENIYQMNITNESETKTYNKIVSVFNNEKCTLLTTKNEHDEIIQHKKYSHCSYKYIAVCGHINEIVYSNFKKKCGLFCKSCTKENVKDKLRKKHQDYIKVNDNTEHFTSEYNGYLYIKKILCNEFIIKKTNEGCFFNYTEARIMYNRFKNNVFFYVTLYPRFNKLTFSL